MERYTKIVGQPFSIDTKVSEKQNPLFAENQQQNEKAEVEVCRKLFVPTQKPV